MAKGFDPKPGSRVTHSQHTPKGRAFRCPVRPSKARATNAVTVTAVHL
jgi:hypothetical protein